MVSELLLYYAGLGSFSLAYVLGQSVLAGGVMGMVLGLLSSLWGDSRM